MYLDEPSTGLDPASRRTLWDCIVNAKESNSKSIVLTTHSMEEADALCDRLAIMARGKLRCVGCVVAVLMVGVVWYMICVFVLTLFYLVWCWVLG